MSSLHVDQATWNSVFAGYGWPAEQGAGVWHSLGGGPQQEVSWESLYRAIVALGWTPAHAEALWKGLAVAAAPAPPQPPLPGVTPAPAKDAKAIVHQVAQVSSVQDLPWERNKPAAPAPAERAKRSRGVGLPQVGLPSLASGAPLLRRLLAVVADGVVVLGFGLLCGLLAGISPEQMIGRSASADQRVSLLLAGVAWSLMAGLYFLLTMRRDSHPGQSPGKQLTGLQVVRSSGEPLDARTILVRQVAGVVLLPWLVCWLLNQLFFPAGIVAVLVWLLVSLRGTGIPDLLGATRVQDA